MKSQAMLLVIVNFLFVVATAAQPLTEWSRPYGNEDSEACVFIHELDDGGFVIAGSDGDYSTFQRQLHITEVNPDGSVRWTRTLGDVMQKGYYAGCTTSDGGYVIVGYAGTPDSVDAHAFKVSADGDSLWSRRYPVGTASSTFDGVCEVPGGNLLMAGFCTIAGGNRQGLLIRTNSSGVMLWDEDYGDENTNFFRSQIKPTHDGYYLIAGETILPDRINMWLVKLTSAGGEVFSRTYGGEDIERAECVVERVSGDYVIGGHTYSFGDGTYSNAWLVLASSSGDSLATANYDDQGGSESCQELVALDDGGVVGAYSHWVPNIPHQDAWIIKTDWYGATQWTKLIGTDSLDTPTTIIQTADGGFAFGGVTETSAGDYDAWLTKLGDEGPHSLCVRPHYNTPHMKLFFKTSLPGEYYIYSTFDPNLATSPPAPGWDLLESLTVVGAGNVSWDHDNALGSDVLEQRRYVVIRVPD